MRGMTVIVEFSLPVLYVNFIFMSNLKEYKNVQAGKNKKNNNRAVSNKSVHAGKNPRKK